MTIKDLKSHNLLSKLINHWYSSSKEELCFCGKCSYYILGLHMEFQEYEKNEESKNYKIKKTIKNNLRMKVFRRDNFQCKVCSYIALESIENLSVDHIIPESKGGTQDLENLRTLCRKCNSSKGAKMPEQI